MQNVADAILSLSASSTAGALVPSNLLSDFKSKVWRSVGTTAALTLTWTSAQTIGVVALPFVNFSSTATMRVRAYTNAADSIPIYDSTAKSCCQYSPVNLWNWGIQPLGANSFSFAGGAYAVLWIPLTACRKLVIDVADNANPQGYLEAARLVTGSYWSPQVNPGLGASTKPDDASEHSRNDAGDLITVRGPRSKKLALDLNYMTLQDRQYLHDLLMGNGKSRPFFLSLSPENTLNPALEQANQVWGKLSEISELAWTLDSTFSTKLIIEEV